jgi:hypothetical protein
MAKEASPADVIREVIFRTCGVRPRNSDQMSKDLHLDRQERAELLVALELALRCEAGDIQLTDDLTVSDLIRALKDRAA